MLMQSVRCPVLGAHVTQVTDLEGTVTHVICAEYQTNGSCRLKTAAQEGGPLSQLLERMAEDSLSTPSTACILRMVRSSN
jgi:hypothetical protein